MFQCISGFRVGAGAYPCLDTVIWCCATSLMSGMPCNTLKSAGRCAFNSEQLQHTWLVLSVLFVRPQQTLANCSLCSSEHCSCTRDKGKCRALLASVAVKLSLDASKNHRTRDQPCSHTCIRVRVWSRKVEHQHLHSCHLCL